MILSRASLTEQPCARSSLITCRVRAITTSDECRAKSMGLWWTAISQAEPNTSLISFSRTATALPHLRTSAPYGESKALSNVPAHEVTKF
jgi:hypothetical protein